MTVPNIRPDFPRPEIPGVDADSVDDESKVDIVDIDDEYEHWSMTEMSDVSDPLDEMLNELPDGWEDYLYSDSLTQSIKFTMESERGASVQGQKFFIVVATDTSGDTPPVRLDDMVPELIPSDVSLKILEIVSMKLLRTTISEEKVVQSTVAYGIKDEAVAQQIIDDLMDAYLEADDDVATAVLEDMEDMFPGLV